MLMMPLFPIRLFFAAITRVCSHTCNLLIHKLFFSGSTPPVSHSLATAVRPQLRPAGTQAVPRVGVSLLACNLWIYLLTGMCQKNVVLLIFVLNFFICMDLGNTIDNN